jgi:hypothetical protein
MLGEKNVDLQLSVSQPELSENLFDDLLAHKQTNPLSADTKANTLFLFFLEITLKGSALSEQSLLLFRLLPRLFTQHAPEESNRRDIL